MKKVHEFFKADKDETDLSKTENRKENIESKNYTSRL